MNLDAGQPVRALNPDDISLSGSVIGVILRNGITTLIT